MEARAFESLKGKTYAFVDVETNGMSATHGQIIEIGIIRVEDGTIAATYESLLRPARGVPAFITTLTGIRNEDLENAPSFFEEALRIRELLDGAIFVAHNARFDYSFIKNEFKRIGMPYTAKTLCTVKLSRRLFPTERSHSLDSLIARHGLSVTDRHRAYDDADVMLQFIEKAEEMSTLEEMAAAINYVLGNHTLPKGLDPAIVKGLPRAPGVYLFYDTSGTLLYVGKSVDIRTRVLSHFSGDHASGKEREMCDEVASIEHMETKGELGALLLESRLVKERAPVYNHALRKAKALALLRASTNRDGYTTLAIAYEEDLDPTEQDVLGIFKSVAQAKGYLRKVVRAHELCPKLAGLEKAPGACFSYQLGKCRGACVGAEAVDAYNTRVTEAFGARAIRAWPFQGPVMLKEEQGEDEGIAYIIDTWKLIGVFTYTSGEFVEESFEDAAFDYDTYKILTRHILKNPKRVSPYTPPTRDEGIIT